MALLHCVITSPEGLVFEGEARMVVVPATDGELGILPRHAPLVGALGSGEVRVDVAGGQKQRFFIDGGFLQVLKNRVTILATVAEPLDRAAREANRAVAEAKLKAILASQPPRAASLEARDAHLAKVRAAQRRLKLVG